MKRFLTISCLGCAGLVAVVALTLVLIGWVGGKRAQFTDSTASYEPLTLGEVEASADLGSIPRAATHRIVLRLAGVDEARIRPCDPGQAMRVDAAYDENRIEFSETMTTADDGGWEYLVEMSGSGSELTRLLQRLFGGRKSTLELCLPRDVPFEFEAAIARGGAQAELGGLWITGVDVSMEMGGGLVRFGEPLREPADYVNVRASMGGGLVAGLGNASPAELVLENRMGGFTADLSGDWRRDVLIRVDGSQGGSTLILPRGVRVEGGPDTIDPAGASESSPALRFAPGTDFDRITIQRR